MYHLIKQAIQERKQVHAFYDGHHRQMCPHVLGLKNGKEHALFYQFGGTSESGKLGWKCMNISELSNVTLHDGPWHTDHSHSRPQTCVGEIDVQVFI